MDFRIAEPCDERWEEMAPRGEGRFCQRCEHTVVDLSRMTRAQAEARLRRARGEYLCVQLAVGEDEAAVFRPSPARAPHWAGGLLLTAALTTAGCSERASAHEAEVAEVEGCATDDPPPLTPMMPIDLEEAPLEATPVSEVVSHEVEEAEGVPTAEQRALTRAKERARIEATRPVQRIRGRMPLRR